MLDRLRRHARQLKTDIYTLYLARGDPRIPWYARLLAICVVGYAFSPIDLIPDGIPILGYLDDLILIPLGIALTLRMIPHEVLAEYREQARLRLEQGRPTSWVAGGIIVAIWALLAAGVALLIWRLAWR